jgi:hypothetical protein
VSQVRAELAGNGSSLVINHLAAELGWLWKTPRWQWGACGRTVELHRVKS